jgi:hypothetical protein
MEPMSWHIANGASGTYRRNDQMLPVKVGLFEDYMDAVKYIYTPQPDALGVYRRMHAAGYSVGEFGLNWICQTTSNAFTAYRWGATWITPSGWLLYGTYGNLGVSSWNFYGKVLTGCVPGNRCFYNQPPFGPSIVETVGSLEGWGYGLERFWAPPKGGWWNSDADFNNEPPDWPMWSNSVWKASGAL